LYACRGGEEIKESHTFRIVVDTCLVREDGVACVSSRVDMKSVECQLASNRKSTFGSCLAVMSQRPLEYLIFLLLY
jgi:hypothetical protein